MLCEKNKGGKGDYKKPESDAKAKGSGTLPGKKIDTGPMGNGKVTRWRCIRVSIENTGAGGGYICKSNTEGRRGKLKRTKKGGD